MSPSIEPGRTALMPGLPTDTAASRYAMKLRIEVDRHLAVLCAAADYPFRLCASGPRSMEPRFWVIDEDGKAVIPANGVPLAVSTMLRMLETSTAVASRVSGLRGQQTLAAAAEQHYRRLELLR